MGKFVPPRSPQQEAPSKREGATKRRPPLRTFLVGAFWIFQIILFSALMLIPLAFLTHMLYDLLQVGWNLWNDLA